jgi:type I restriction enzyme S subunit
MRTTLPEERLEKGWSRVRFGDVVAQVRDRVDPEESGLERYVAGEHMDTDDPHIRRWGTIGEGYLGPAFHMRFKPGHVLYGSRRTYLRKVAVADFEGITANTTFVVEPRDPNVLLPEFLPLIMQAEPFHAYSISQSKGSVNPYINFSDLVPYELDLPPAETQREIVELLGAGDSVVERLGDAVNSARTVYRSVAASLLSSGRSDSIDPAEWMPDGWECSRLADLVDASSPICYGIVQVGRDVPDGIPTLQIKDLSGDFRSGVHRTAASIEARYSRSRVQPGDVLVSIEATVGEVTTAPAWFHGNIGRHVARVRIDSAKLISQFFVHLYRSPPFIDYVRSLLTGSTRAELSIGVLRELLIPHPQLDEQIRIADALDSVLRCEMSLDERRKLAREVNRSMLHRTLETPVTHQ